MMYGKVYLDKYFGAIDEPRSIKVLTNIAMANHQEKAEMDWILQLNEILKWQASSERGGVAVYYSKLTVELSIKVSAALKSIEDPCLLDIYTQGIGKFIMGDNLKEFDVRILAKKSSIYDYVRNELLNHKDWFYELSQND